MNKESMRFFEESRERVHKQFPKIEKTISSSEVSKLLKERGVTNLSDEIVKERYTVDRGDV